ncbi:methyl-accepting chemotaxis protein [Lachnospiraceae bacterium C1.1]|nr:methyl-accepting chemotaxis protein [Lachnospiraceae bacterium C1.1]
MAEKVKEREVNRKVRKRGKIRNKLLIFIVPTVVLLVAILVMVTVIIVKDKLTSMTISQLESSLENQGDNIESWLDENLEFFQTAKDTVEGLKANESELQKLLDTYCGVNSNAPDGVYVISEDGTFLKASESTKEISNPVESEAYTQGITRINMDYGEAYKDDGGEYVISAAGIINDGNEKIRVMAADVSLQKISIIVNSDVKMTGASSLLLDDSTGTILANRDTSLISTQLTQENSNKLLSDVAKKLTKRDYTTEVLGDYVVSVRKISGTDWILVSYISTNAFMSNVQSLGRMMILIGIIAVIIIIVITCLVINHVIAPLSVISKHIGLMTSGDFTIEIKNSGNDEIGIMAEQVGEFTGKMRTMMSSIFEEAIKLKDESDKSNEVSENMSEAASASAEAMQQLNDTVGQLAEAVNDIAENATILANVVSDTKTNSDKAGESMHETVDIASKGKDEMEQLSVAMEGILKSNDKLVESIGKVGEASDKITDIVGLIANISEETNLLSLNASIEAARAGEAGKGFAVVATEIGKLAQTSSENTQNIAELVEEIRRMIEGVVEQSNSNSESIQDNSGRISMAVQTFDNIYNNIQASDSLIRNMQSDFEKVSDVATNVAAISEEQAASADEILATSENMVEQAKNISSSSQDVAENAKELSATADTLDDFVSKFKV